MTLIKKKKKKIKDINDRTVTSIRKSGCFTSEFPITIGFY